MGLVIEVTDLERRFGKIKAVDGVTFEVDEGEVFGFLGPNGAGKTTSINILCTLLQPTNGTARLAGYDVVKDADNVRRSIGIVFQDPSLDERLTAWENLEFHAMVYGVSPRSISGRMRSLLEMVELSDRRDGIVRTFSGGMKRRLEIARGLLHSPRVLFLDEPTIGLDPQTRRRMWEYIASLKQQEPVTIFMTTHYMEEAEWCDRIAVIDHGRIIALGSPAELKNTIGGDVVTIRTEDPTGVAAELAERFSIASRLDDTSVSFTVSDGGTVLPKILRESRFALEEIALKKPTLDDVFIHLTGRELRDELLTPAEATKERWRRS